MPRLVIPSVGPPFVTLPPGWDAAWVAAKAAAGSAPARVLVVGDSIACGSYASTWGATWVQLMRNALVARLGRAADYYPAYGLSADAGVHLGGTPPWTALNAAGTAAYNMTSGYHGIVMNNVSSSTYFHQTFTSPDPCTALDLLHFDTGLAANWSYSVDGGADVVVSNTASATVKRISVSGLASATHSVAMGKQTGLFGCRPEGVVAYSGSAGGLAFARFAAPGQQLVDWLNGSQDPTNRPELFAGLNPQAAGARTPLTFGFPTQPHLLILALGVNDCTNAVAQASYETVLRRMIQGARAGAPNASVLLLAYCNPDNELTDATNAFAGQNWPTYMDSMRRYAGLYGAAFVNIHARWGEAPVGRGFLTVANTVHPTDAGHADIASVLLGVL